MLSILKTKNNLITIKGIFIEDIKDKMILQEPGTLTELINQKIAYLNLGKKEKYSYCVLKKYFQKLFANQLRDYNLDIKTFLLEKVCENDVISLVVEIYQLQNHPLFTLKKKKLESKKLFLENIKNNEFYKEKLMIAKAINYTRDLQITPPNIQNSENYAFNLKEKFKNYKNIDIKILDRKEIEKNQMNLLLAVNAGSKYEPRVVILEYQGNPQSKEKTCMIGKGIVFDAGGMNIKTGRYMLGMKYDMSGSAIVAGTMELIANLKPKINVSAVLVITDNMVSSKSVTPDSVITAMNGKTVEINNTDAEGRLAMADGLTYAIKKLDATKLIDVATLTGAVLVALGNTYTGVWTKSDILWKKLQKASKEVHEKIWRLPLHEDFAKFIKKSHVADIKNTDLTGLGGANSAAMFLQEFNEGIDHIHFDVAGSANIKEIPTGSLVKTLFNFLKQS